MVSALNEMLLEGTWPNPSRGGPLAVHFALPNGAAAILELFDVAGRLVDSRAVGFLGEGSHRIETNPVPAGVYYMRLSQGSNVKVKRAIVLD